MRHRPDSGSSEDALVVVGDPGLVSSENFQITFLGLDDFQRFIDMADAPTSAFALVRRRAPTSPAGWAWDLYTTGWNPLAADRDILSTQQQRQPGMAESGSREIPRPGRRLP